MLMFHIIQKLKKITSNEIEEDDDGGGGEGGDGDDDDADEEADDDNESIWINLLKWTSWSAFLTIICLILGEFLRVTLRIIRKECDISYRTALYTEISVVLTVMIIYHAISNTSAHIVLEITSWISIGKATAFLLREGLFASFFFRLTTIFLFTFFDTLDSFASYAS